MDNSSGEEGGREGARRGGDGDGATVQGSQEKPASSAAADAGAAGCVGEWRVAYDPASGHPYYFNSRTGEVTWSAPPGAPSSVTGAGSAATAPYQAAHTPYSSSGASYPTATIVAAPFSMPTSSSSSFAPPQLPPELQKLHKALERVDGSSSDSHATLKPTTNTTATHDAGNRTLQTNIPMASPPASGSVSGAWVELMDEHYGRPYYYHTTTGHTQWEVPPGFTEQSITTYQRPAPPDATHELTLFEDHFYQQQLSQAVLNKRTGRLSVGAHGPGHDHDRDLRQLSHYMDVSALPGGGEDAKRRRQQGLEDVDWKAVREEQRAKKKHRALSWLYKD